MTPRQLDEQCEVVISEWVDIHGTRCKEMDDNYKFTLQCLRAGMESGMLFTDSLGRLFGKGEGGKFFPFHFEYGSKLVGYRIPARAAN